jgi:myosin-1
MSILMAKEPSYVRCIKPNGEKKANCWDPAAVQHQVKYLGLMESLRVARAGTVPVFLTRRHLLSA